MHQKIEKAAKILKQANNIVAFTGAGISVESGIPDFRSKGGLWSRFDPELYASYWTFVESPHYYWNLEKELSKMIGDVKPNPAHYALAELEKMGKLKAIITQNIDMLHQAAGNTVPILELHGSSQAGRCIKCGKKYTREQIVQKMNTIKDPQSDKEVPRCDSCKGLVKFDIVLFGENLPMGVLNKAEKYAMECDCMLVIGSSLAVAPANMIPGIAREVGAKLIVINLDDTIIDSSADVHLLEKAGVILPKIIEKMKK
jgi:NAD-dependent deacetylase